MLTEGGTEAMLGSLDESVTAVATFGARETVTRSVPGVPLGSVSAAGVMLVTTGGGGVTCTTVAALVPFTEAVTFAVPLASAFTGIVAEIAPAAMVALAATCATVGASFASAMTVSVFCAALILTVKLLVAPTFMVKLAGSSAVTATGGATTLTTAEAVVPFKLAVMPAWPSASVPTATGAVVWPASTVTCVEIDTMPVGVAFNGTTVLVLCAAEIVSVSVVLAPRATVDVAGTSDTTVGAAGLTLIWLEADDPFRLAVICAVPGETPATGMTADTRSA